jgi:hypothetical protein
MADLTGHTLSLQQQTAGTYPAIREQNVNVINTDATYGAMKPLKYTSFISVSTDVSITTDVFSHERRNKL